MMSVQKRKTITTVIQHGPGGLDLVLGYVGLVSYLGNLGMDLWSGDMLTRLKLVTQYTQQLGHSKVKFSRANFFYSCQKFSISIGGEFISLFFIFR